MMLGGLCGNVCCLAGSEKARGPDPAELLANRPPGCAPKWHRKGGRVGEWQGRVPGHGCTAALGI